MYCSKCGNEVKDDAKFCPRCGAPLFENKENTFTPVATVTKKRQSTVLMASLSLACGIFGFIPFFGFIFSVVALFLGLYSREESMGKIGIGLGLASIIFEILFGIIVLLGLHGTN